MNARLVRAISAALLIVVFTGAGCTYSTDSADRDYTRAFCAAVDDFSDALANGDIGPALESFEADLVAIPPPARVAAFHQAFIEYVKDVAADASSLSSREAPKLDPEVRAALGDLEPKLDECWNPSYFGQRN